MKAGGAKLQGLKAKPKAASCSTAIAAKAVCVIIAAGKLRFLFFQKAAGR